jgi:putative phosphoribosyl transferase
MRIVERTEHSGAVESMPVRFADRRDAGRRLAMLLSAFRYEDPIVAGIARGGMPVAAEVAGALQAPLEVVVVGELVAPENLEHPIGALAESDIVIIDDEAVRRVGLSTVQLAALVRLGRQQLSKRLTRDYAKRPRLAVAGRTVLLVDDGLVETHRAQAAARWLRLHGARRIVLAAPVAARESTRELHDWVDDVVCVADAGPWSIRQCYKDFAPTSDEEVSALLAEPSGGVAREVSIEVHTGLVLRGKLTVPWGAHGRGVVAFAHGGCSTRGSPRNQQIARALNDAGFATLLFDLLSPREERDRASVFGSHRPDTSELALPARRLVAATHWLRRQPETAQLALGYFGASSGSAVALLAAAELGAGVRAVVSHGGRPDLAQPRLGEILAPVLLIVGGADAAVLELNRRAQAHLCCENELAVVPSATLPSGEPGALEQVGRLTIDWFTQHLCQGAPGPNSEEHDARLSLTV